MSNPLTYDLPTLTQVIGTAAEWQPRNDSAWDVRYYDVQTNSQWARYTNENLAAFDPRLPVVLDKLSLAKGRHHSRVEVPGYLVEETVRSWQRLYQIPNVSGAYFQASLLIDLEPQPVQPWQDPYGHIVVVEGNFVSQTVDTGGNGMGPALTYILHADTETMDVPSTWFDANYPGWRERFAVCEVLGLCGAAMIEHVLHCAALAPVQPVDDLTFD